jgi:hypothetical protein
MTIRPKIGKWLAGCGLVLALTAAGLSQQPSGQGTPGHGSSSPQTPPSLSPISPGDTGISPEIQQDQAKLRNADRQKQLVTDTQKLLVLAQELKFDVDKSNKDTLSLDVIRKADEIEKLAHSVKEKMKGN